MVYLKAIQKSAPMGVSVSGTTDQKTYLKKFMGVFSPLNPPGSAYDTWQRTMFDKTDYREVTVCAEMTYTL